MLDKYLCFVVAFSYFIFVVHTQTTPAMCSQLMMGTKPIKQHNITHREENKFKWCCRCCVIVFYCLNFSSAWLCCCCLRVIITPAKISWWIKTRQKIKIDKEKFNIRLCGFFASSLYNSIKCLSYLASRYGWNEYWSKRAPDTLLFR